MEKDIVEKADEFIQGRGQTMNEARQLIQDLRDEVVRLRDFEPPQ